MNNQTIPLLPAELFFSMGRLASISSLLLILVLVLIIIFLLFFQQRNTSVFDEHELRSETDPTGIENRALEPERYKQYASTDNDLHRQSITMTTTINSSQPDVDEQNTQSTTNLIASK